MLLGLLSTGALPTTHGLSLYCSAVATELHASLSRTRVSKVRAPPRDHRARLQVCRSFFLPVEEEISDSCRRLAFFLLIKVIGRTIRWQVDGWENWEAATREGQIPIYTFWHNRVFLATYFWRSAASS